MPEDLYVSAHVGANKVVIQDPLVEHRSADGDAADGRNRAHRHEADQRHGDVDLHGFREDPAESFASVVIDGSILFSGNGFPSYMTPAAKLRRDPMAEVVVDSKAIRELAEDFVKAKRAFIGRLAERGYQLLRDEIKSSAYRTGNLLQGVARPTSITTSSRPC
jgi:hypothetical protein